MGALDAAGDYRVMRVIVVGSGVVGASCAYTASSLGAEVVLADAALPGRATAAGAGIVCPWSSSAGDPVWYEFGVAAAARYPKLIEELAGLGETEVGFRQVGALLLADSAGRQEHLSSLLVARRAHAPQVGAVESLTGAEASGLFPPLRAGQAAVYVGGACRVNGRLLADALVRAAADRGAVVTAGRAGLACRAGRAVGVILDGQLIEADAVVAATGAWTASFLEPSGVRLAVAPQRGQIVHISMRPADISRWPVVQPDGSGHYLLAFDDHRVVAGATRETGSGFDYRVTPGGLAEVLGQALAVAPGLATGSYLETRVGFRPMSPDLRPLLGPVSGVGGLVVATGLGATGLTMGPYAGELAARAALGEPPGIDLAPFDPLRPAIAASTGTGATSTGTGATGTGATGTGTGAASTAAAG
jgi:D-amino-acid dehydrogenase